MFYMCNKCIGMYLLVFFWVLYVGPGARLVASLEGRGAQLWRRPGSKYFRSLFKWSLGLKHFVLEGVM